MNALGPPAALTPEQIDLIWRSCVDAASEATAERACRRLAERMAHIIGAPVVVFRRDVTPWKLVVQAGEPAIETALPAPESLDTGSQADPNLAPAGQAAPTTWTPVRINDQRGSDWMLALPGDWQSAGEWLSRFIETASLSVGLAASRDSQQRSENLAAVGYAVSRKLGQISDERDRKSTRLNSSH